MEYLKFTEYLVNRPTSVFKYDSTKITDNFNLILSVIGDSKIQNILMYDTWPALQKSLVDSGIMSLMDYKNVYYSFKCYSVLEGIPSELLYYLYKIQKDAEQFKYAPNYYLYKIYRFLEPYVTNLYATEGGTFSLLELILNITGLDDIKLLQDYNRIVKVNTDMENPVYEAFFEQDKVRAITILPNDIGKQMTEDNWRKVKYQVGTGLYLPTGEDRKILLRTMGSRLGIREDDFRLDKSF